MTLGLLALGGLFALVALTTDHGVGTRTYRATFDARRVLAACDAYREHPSSGGKYPESLGDLRTPPFGGSSFLRDGEDESIDPWGNPFRYAVVTAPGGGQEVYVWGERVAGGKLTLVGAKRTTEGAVEVFR